jgi:hypothetical protein
MKTSSIFALSAALTSCISPKSPSSDNAVSAEITASEAADSFNPSVEYIYELSECVPKVVRGRRSPARTRINFTFKRGDLSDKECLLEVIDPTLVARDDVYWPDSRPGVIFTSSSPFALDKAKEDRYVAEIDLRPSLILVGESKDLKPFSVPVKMPTALNEEAKKSLAATMQCSPALPFPGRFLRQGEQDTLTFFLAPPHPKSISCRTVAVYARNGEPRAQNLTPEATFQLKEDGTYTSNGEFSLELR